MSVTVNVKNVSQNRLVSTIDTYSYSYIILYSLCFNYPYKHINNIIEEKFIFVVFRFLIYAPDIKDNFMVFNVFV